jgi:hypothetical protein
MKRRLFKLAAVVSLLLCLGAIAAWVDSYWEFRVGWIEVGKIAVSVVSDHGNITFTAVRFRESASPGRGSLRPVFKGVNLSEDSDYGTGMRAILGDSALGISMHTPENTWHGFAIEHGSGSLPGLRQVRFDAANPDYRVLYISAPPWILVLITSALPAGWLVGRWKRRRRVVGSHCEKCGYDLRATPDRCPECGTLSVVARASSLQKRTVSLLRR